MVIDGFARRVCIDAVIGAELRMSVFTGNIFGAGTNSKVFATIYGDKTDSGLLQFDQSNRHS